MTPNINPETGIAYGYISANALHPDIVHELQYGPQAKEPYYEEAWKEHVEQMRQNYDAEMQEQRDKCARDGTDFVEDNYDAFDEEDYRESFNDSYSPDEPVHEGEKDGVKYRTSWLGGALHVWIFESPYITEKAGRASPCVPGAGILDDLHLVVGHRRYSALQQSEGDVRAYDVPPAWRDDDERV